MQATHRSPSPSSTAPRQVRAQLRVFIRLDGVRVVLVVAAAMKELARRADAERSVHGKKQVDARVLQKVIRTHSVERIDLAADVKEQRPVAAIVGEPRERAEI